MGLEEQINQMYVNIPYINRILKGKMVIPLIFPKVPQSFLGMLRVPQSPPPLEHPSEPYKSKGW